MRLKEIFDRPVSPAKIEKIEHPMGMLYTAEIDDKELSVEFIKLQVTDWVAMVQQFYKGRVDSKKLNDMLVQDFRLDKASTIHHIGFAVDMSQETLGTGEIGDVLQTIATVKKICLDYHTPGNIYLVGSTDSKKLMMFTKVLGKYAKVTVREFDNISFCLAVS